MIFKNIRKALIIQTAFIGDVVLTTPLIAALYESIPDIKIDFLTIPASSSILSNHEMIHETIIFDKNGSDKGIRGLWQMAKLLKSKNYDICMVPHRSFRSAFLAYFTQAEIRVGFDRSAFKSAFTSVVVYKENLHEIERNLSLLSVLGLSPQIKSPIIFGSERDKSVIQELWAELNLKAEDLVLAIAPGSVWPTKRWPEDYYANLCRRLKNHEIIPVLIGSREDKSLTERISEQSGGTLTIAGRTTLTQSYEFLTRCQGIISNDSAPLHLGMAAQIPVFAIFGPTVTEFGFAPLGNKGFVLENKDLNCRPCSIHGGNKCPIKTFECMLSLKPEQMENLITNYYFSASDHI